MPLEVPKDKKKVKPCGLSKYDQEIRRKVLKESTNYSEMMKEIGFSET